MSNINLKGIVCVEILENDKIVKTVTSENLITNQTYLTLLSSSDSLESVFNNKNIFISQDTDTPVRSPSNVNALAIGSDPANIITPNFYPEANPPYGEIIQEIGFVNQTRDFSIIGLTSLGSNDNYNSTITSGQNFAYLLLDDAPCTQGETQVVRITYQIQFSLNGTSLWRASTYGASLFNLGSNYDLNRLTTSLVSGDFSDEYSGLAYPLFTGTADGSVYSGDVSSNTANTNTFTKTYSSSYTFDTDTIDGLIINFIGHGLISYSVNSISANYLIGYGKYTENISSPYQVGFWHNTPSPVHPFFDISYEGLSEGSISHSGTWTGKIPIMMRIEITTGGEVGVAAYRFYIKPISGFKRNTWEGRGSSVPFINAQQQLHPSSSGWSANNRVDGLVYSKENMEVIYADSSSISLLSVYTGQARKWDGNNSFLATDIKQVCIAGNPGSENIFVACANTGVWEIDVVANSVSHRVSGVGAYGIATGYNNEVFALCNGSLRSSYNWAIGLSFTYTGISDNNWNLVRHIVADKNNTNNRLAITRETSFSSGIYEIVWWDKGSGLASTGPQSNNLSQNKSIQVLSSGTWLYMLNNNLNGYGIAKVLHGELTGTDTGKISTVGNTGDRRNQQIILTQGKAFYESDTPAFYNPDTLSNLTNEIESFSLFDAVILELADCFYYVQQDTSNGLAFLRQFDNSKTDGASWTAYGWDGSSWVKDLTTSRLTHSNPESTIQGINVSFTNGDGVASNSFVMNEFFHRVVANGIIKTNATNITLSYLIHHKNIISSNDSGTIPSSSPYQDTLDAVLDIDFISILSDDSSQHTFVINGNLVNTIYFDGSLPGPNEISIDPLTAIVTFHSSNSSQSWSASTYKWVSHNPA